MGYPMSNKCALPKKSKQKKLLIIRMTEMEHRAVKKAAMKTGDIYMTRYVKRLVKKALGI